MFTRSQKTLQLENNINASTHKMITRSKSQELMKKKELEEVAEALIMLYNKKETPRTRFITRTSNAAEILINLKNSN
tara:strand:- start:356 stop:586 length:231 start_codon:yes stop_codon:yes gene_type:complete